MSTLLEQVIEASELDEVAREEQKKQKKQKRRRRRRSRRRARRRRGGRRKREVVATRFPVNLQLNHSTLGSPLDLPFREWSYAHAE